MRFQRFILTCLLVLGTVVQGPILNGHVATHLLDMALARSTETWSEASSSLISNPECDLCRAYQLQSIFLEVVVAPVALVSTRTGAVLFSRAFYSLRAPRHFHARAPPDFLFV
jgi:hypothetical protein